MAQGLVGKLGEQINKQVTGFATGMKGAFVSANPALLGPAIGSIEKALKGQNEALRKDREERRAEKGFAEENANEQRKLFTDILGEQKKTNDWLRQILDAILKCCKCDEVRDDSTLKKILGAIVG